MAFYGFFAIRGMKQNNPPNKIMTQKIKIPDTALPNDLVLPFQLDGANARGRIARFDTTLNTIIDQHDYPPAVLMLLAEAVMLSALIGQTIKLRWKLSLQIRGDGPIRLIATDYFAPSTADGAAKIRAYASFDKDRMPEETGAETDNETLEASFKKIGQGAFAILIDQGQGMTPIKGITPLSGASLSSCAETYFHQSEQLPSRFVVKIGTPKKANPKATSPSWSVAGMMVQHLAANSADTTDAAQKGEDWQRTLAHLNTLESAELLDKTLPHETLLYRLFHQESLRIFPTQAVEFGCTCSKSRVKQALSIYSAKDIEKMTLPDNTLTADCQFCGAHYTLSPDSVGFQANKDKDNDTPHDG